MRFRISSRRVGGLITFLLRYLGSSGALAAASFAQLATFALLARAFGPTEFGCFVEISAVSAVAVQVCGLGASDCMIRRVSREPESYPALLGHNLLLIGITGSAIVLVGAIALPLHVTIDPRPAVNVLGLALLLTSNVLLVRTILLAETIALSLGRIRAANAAVIGFALARIATALLACPVFEVHTVAEWAIWQFCGNLLYLLVVVRQLRPLGPPSMVVLREELRSGILFSSQFVVRAIRQNVDLFVIGTFAPAAVVGSYGVARRTMDSSYLTVDALNRLAYPRFARASRDGLHDALPLARRMLAGALALGCTTALMLFVLAPYLTSLFGQAYESLPVFVRYLSGTIILIAAWSVAIDLLGASGRQNVRATILNVINLVGSGIIAVSTWLAAPMGTFFALYLVEIAILVTAWPTLLTLARRSRATLHLRLA